MFSEINLAHDTNDQEVIERVMLSVLLADLCQQGRTLLDLD